MSNTHTAQQSALREGYLLYNPRSGSPRLSELLRHAFIVELANLGFIITNPDDLKNVSQNYAKNVLSAARRIVGSDRDTTPIYPGFPKQVEELSTTTLLVEQILHYLSGGTLLPDYPDVIRPGLPIADAVNSAKKITVTDESVYAFDTLRELSRVTNAFSDQDRERLSQAMMLASHTIDIDAVKDYYMKTKNHENAQAFVIAAIEQTKINHDDLFVVLARNTFNISRLLRLYLAVYTSPLDDDTSKIISSRSRVLLHDSLVMKYNDATRNLVRDNIFAIHNNPVPRSSRRALVNRIGDTTQGYKVDEMLKYKSLWQRIIKHVHGFDYQKNDDALRAMNIVCDNIEYSTLNSDVEYALERGDIKYATDLLMENRRGDFLRRIVTLLRGVKDSSTAQHVSDNVYKAAMDAPVTTVISAYNGILNANSDAARLIRVAGRNNTLVSKERDKVDQEYIDTVLDGFNKSLRDRLKSVPAPSVVGVNSKLPIPLVNRDASTTDSVIDRGSVIDIEGKGDTLRIFSHWTANERQSGYVDLGVVFLGKDFSHQGALTWNTWNRHREVGTYSGDKHVHSGDSAAEYYDVKLAKIRELYPDTRYLAVTLQSWSGYPLNEVDMIAGAMFRSEPDSGEVFDPRSIVSAFSPTTTAMQSIPYVYDLEKNEFIWIDSSSGSTRHGVSAENDHEVGPVVAFELSNKMTFGDLAQLWAQAHDADVSENDDVDIDTLKEFVGI